MSVAVADTAEETERIPFLRSKTFLGAVKRGVRPGITAAMLLEEGAWWAEEKYRWTGIAAVGAVLGEGLWALQLEKERKEGEKGLER